MSFHNQPLDSSHLCTVPFKYADADIPFSPLNSIQKKLIQQIKEKTQVVKQCRICLQDQKQGKLVSPCKCTGSVKYAHNKCLIQWIKRKVEEDPKSTAKCQLCETGFNYKMRQVRIFDCQQLKKNYAIQKVKSSIRCFFVLYTLFVILFLGLIGVYSAAKSGAANGVLQSTLFSSSTSSVVFVCIIVLYFIMLLVILVLFISEYVVRQEVLIAEVNNYKEPPVFVKNFKIYFKR